MRNGATYVEWEDSTVAATDSPTTDDSTVAATNSTTTDDSTVAATNSTTTDDSTVAATNSTTTDDSTVAAAAGASLAGVKAGQVWALLDGAQRHMEGARPPRWWPRKVRWAEAAQAEADRRKSRANRAMREEGKAESDAAKYPRVVRALPTWVAWGITVLLVCASFFTNHTILEMADTPPLESWLLTIAFGPVFVFSTKLAVSWWISQCKDGEDSQRYTTLPKRAMLVMLASGIVAAVVGLAVKAMLIGTVGESLPEMALMVSSALMFGGVAVVEVAGAIGLALTQHASGARNYAAAQQRLRWARWWAGRRINQALRADRVARERLAWLEGFQAWARGRAAMGTNYGWMQAVKQADDGDALLRLVSVPPHTVPGVPEHPLGTPANRVLGETVPVSIDTEFRKLLSVREPIVEEETA